MISVRIPKKLKKALEFYAEEHHFLDVSEAVREYIRKKKSRQDDPYLSEIQRLRKSITGTIKEQALRQSREALLTELRKIDNELRGDAV